MSRGSLTSARDPSGVLCTRMKQARDGELMPLHGAFKPKPPEAKDGDWYCPNCNDLQFKRNIVCRRCGTRNPHDLASSVRTGSTRTFTQPVESHEPSPPTPTDFQAAMSQMMPGMTPEMIQLYLASMMAAQQAAAGPAE